VLTAFDNERARYLSARLALAAGGVLLIDTGVRADLHIARVSVSAPGPTSPCPIEGWTTDHLARAGEDVGLPCAGIDTALPFGSTLAMAQACAAVAVHQALALAGVTAEPAWIGHELRLDLHSGRFERFLRPGAPDCAADHVLAGPAFTPLANAPANMSLGQLMTACGVGPDAVVVLAATEVASAAICPGCGTQSRPYAAIGLGPITCIGCGAVALPLRRARHVRWGEAATTVATATATTWFRPGDSFAVLDGDGARTFAFPPPALPWEAGRAWEPAVDPARFSRLPTGYDLQRIRATKLAILGLGHLGAAILEALAPLPWAGLLLLDGDHLEPHNVAAHALAAAAGALPA
jgi:hypothetical protein